MIGPIAEDRYHSSSSPMLMPLSEAAGPLLSKGPTLLTDSAPSPESVGSRSSRVGLETMGRGSPAKLPVDSLSFWADLERAYTKRKPEMRARTTPNQACSVSFV